MFSISETILVVSKHSLCFRYFIDSSQDVGGICSQGSQTVEGMSGEQAIPYIRNIINACIATLWAKHLFKYNILNLFHLCVDDLKKCMH